MVSNCEEKILKIVMECKKEPDLRTVMDMANETYHTTWKPQTVSTFLARLVKKGYLVGKRKGRYTYYSSTISLEEYRKERLKDMIQFWYDGDSKSAIKDLVQILYNGNTDEAVKNFAETTTSNKNTELENNNS